MAMQTAQESVQAAVDQARDELRRADAKAQTMVTLVGAAFGGIVALTRTPMPPLPDALVWAAVVPIAVAVGVLLSVLCPHIGVGEPGSWVHAARCTPDELVALHESCGTSVLRVATTHTVISRLVARKYRRIAWAVWLLAAGLGVLLAALVVATWVGA